MSSYSHLFLSFQAPAPLQIGIFYNSLVKYPSDHYNASLVFICRPSVFHIEKTRSPTSTEIASHKVLGWEKCSRLQISQL